MNTNEAMVKLHHTARETNMKPRLKLRCEFPFSGEISGAGDTLQQSTCFHYQKFPFVGGQDAPRV